MRHDDALASRQSVCLDDEWRILLPDVSERRFQFVKITVSPRRYPVLREKVLGKNLRPLEFRPGRIRTEAGTPLFAKAVDYSVDQRHFGADDRQVNLFIFGQLKQAVDILSVDGDIAYTGFERRTGISRCD